MNFSDPMGLSPWPLVPIASAALEVGRASMERVALKAAAATINIVAGTIVGKAIGYPNDVGVNRGGLQPRGDDGRWLRSSANPGLGATVAQVSQSDGAQNAMAIVNGVAKGLGADMGPFILGSERALKVEQKTEAVTRAVVEIVNKTNQD